MSARYNPHTVRRCFVDQNFRDGHTMHRQSENGLRMGCHVGMRVHQHSDAGASHSNSTAHLAQRLSTGREVARVAKTMRREWTSRELTNLEWRAYSYGPPFLLKGVIEPTARYSYRPPSPPHGHPSRVVPLSGFSSPYAHGLPCHPGP